MKYTNKHNLPEWLVRQLLPQNPHLPDPKRMSVTDLIAPPRMRTLKIQKWDEITTDVSDLLNFFDGNNLDRAFKNDPEEQIKLELLIDGITLVGQLDRLIVTPDSVTVVDRKRTKVGGAAYGDTRRSWIAQLNCYAWLLQRTRGIETTKLENHVSYKDWSPVKMYTKDYPQWAWQIIQQPLWSFEHQELYIRQQLEYHAANPMDCPVEERWGSFAVMANGRKTALRVLKTRQKYETWMEDNQKGDFVENRDCLRCKHFCSVSSVCQDAYNKEKTNV